MNPFYFRKISVDAPFCDRVKELEELKSHARNCANIVLISSRRYGKTSLVQRVQHQLSQEGLVTIYIDLYGVTSLDDVAARIATNVYKAVHSNEPLFKKAARLFSNFKPKISFDYTSPEEVSIGLDTTKGKSGKELLEDTLEGLGQFINDSKNSCCVAIDEFQEITEISDAKFIEGTMRSHIQNHSNASYFFVGSRRRILADMFNSKNRPFYKSAINIQLSVFPEEDLLEFLVNRFESGEKACSRDAAKLISDRIERNPYYSQKLAYHIYEISGSNITQEDVNNGYINLLQDEKTLFEIMIQGLGNRQLALLIAIAKEPTKKPFTIEYISSHGIGSVGAAQGGFKKLAALDYIENLDTGWKVVDPVFAEWLRNR